MKVRRNFTDESLRINQLCNVVSQLEERLDVFPQRVGCIFEVISFDLVRSGAALRRLESF